MAILNLFVLANKIQKQYKNTGVQGFALMLGKTIKKSAEIIEVVKHEKDLNNVINWISFYESKDCILKHFKKRLINAIESDIKNIQSNVKNKNQIKMIADKISKLYYRVISIDKCMPKDILIEILSLLQPLFLIKRMTTINHTFYKNALHTFKKLSIDCKLVLQTYIEPKILYDNNNYSTIEINKDNIENIPQYLWNNKVCLYASEPERLHFKKSVACYLTNTKTIEMLYCEFYKWVECLYYCIKHSTKKKQLILNGCQGN